MTGNVYFRILYSTKRCITLWLIELRLWGNSFAVEPKFWAKKSTIFSASLGICYLFHLMVLYCRQSFMSIHIKCHILKQQSTSKKNGKNPYDEHVLMV